MRETKFISNGHSNECKESTRTRLKSRESDVEQHIERISRRDTYTRACVAFN